jgi:glutaconate CoA-transferase subunit B
MTSDVMQGPPTTDEVIACYMAHELRDGERVSVGANLPIVRCGALLAHLLYGPNMRLLISMSFTSLLHAPTPEAYPTAMDFRGTRLAEAFVRHDETLQAVPRLADSFVVGGLQVDPYGNSNLIGRAGTGERRFAMRGPGALAAPSMADHVSRFYIFLTRHTPEALVERCDFISCVGWGRPDLPGHTRQALGLPGGGPRACITPLAILDFGGPQHRARLASVHPGVDPREVVARTGFSLELPARVPTTPLPTPEELRVLRTRIDPGGALRTPRTDRQHQPTPHQSKGGAPPDGHRLGTRH